MTTIATALITDTEARVQLDKSGGQGDSDRIQRLIVTCSEELKSILKRRIVTEGTITEYHWVRRSESEIMVREFPIIAAPTIHESAASPPVYDATTLLTEGTDYVVDYDTGIITRMSSGSPTAWCTNHEGVRIVYTGGYSQADVPQDLKQLCAEFVHMKYVAVERNLTNQSSVSDGLGTRNYTAPADLTSWMRERARRHRRYDIAGAETMTRQTVAA